MNGLDNIWTSLNLLEYPKYEYLLKFVDRDSILAESSFISFIHHNIPIQTCIDQRSAWKLTPLSSYETNTSDQMTNWCTHHLPFILHFISSFHTFIFTFLNFSLFYLFLTFLFSTNIEVSTSILSVKLGVLSLHLTLLKFRQEYLDVVSFKKLFLESKFHPMPVTHKMRRNVIKKVLYIK